MEENTQPFTKQSVENILNKIASNRKYSPNLPTEPPRQDNEEAFQSLMSKSTNFNASPSPQPFQDLLNQQPPTKKQEEKNV